MALICDLRKVPPHVAVNFNCWKYSRGENITRQEVVGGMNWKDHNSVHPQLPGRHENLEKGLACQTIAGKVWG